MGAKSRRIVIGVGVLLFVVGFIMLLSATNIGIDMANDAIKTNGGSMDTEMYYLIMHSSTLSLQIAGAVGSLFGGVATLMAVFKRDIVKI